MPWVKGLSDEKNTSLGLTMEVLVKVYRRLSFIYCTERNKCTPYIGGVASWNTKDIECPLKPLRVVHLATIFYRAAFCILSLLRFGKNLKKDAKKSYLKAIFLGGYTAESPFHGVRYTAELPFHCV